jgi:SPP1 gp7 family putative phage head morphogenesis protein
MTKGLSPYAAAAIPSEQDAKADQFNNAMLENYGALGGVLTSDSDVITRQELIEYKEAFEDEYTGAGAAGRVAALAHGMKYDRFAPTNVDMQYAEMRKDNRLRIQAAYGMNEGELGIFESGMNRATAEQADRSAWEKTRLPLDQKVWDSINNLWLRFMEGGNLRGKSDLSAVPALKQNFTDQISDAQKLWSMDVPAAEALRVAGVPIDVVKYPWLEKKFVAAGQVDIEVLAEQGYIAPMSMAYPPPEAAKSTVPVVKEAPQTDIEQEIRYRMWDEYVRAVLDPGEKALQRKMERFFYDLRNVTLDKIDAWRKFNAVNDDSTPQKALTVKEFVVDPMVFLFDVDEPEVAAQMKRELARLKQDYGDAINFNVTPENIDEAIKVRADKVLSIPDTTFKQVEDKVLDVMDEGMSNNWTVDEMARKMRQEVSDAFQMSVGRSRTIARTEASSISSWTREEAFDESGITQVEWLSAGDERVRASHQIDGQRVVRGQPFSNGLRYPSDPLGPPSEVINCRCVALPVIETRSI